MINLLKVFMIQDLLIEDFDNLTTNIGDVSDDFIELEKEIDIIVIDIASVNNTVGKNAKDIDTYHPKHQPITSKLLYF